MAATAGTNAAAGDFTQTGTMLTIEAGETASTGAVTVTAVDNAKDEADKSVTVSAAVSGASGVANPAAVTLTIADDDATPAVSISSPSVTEGAAGATATLTFEVTLSAVSGKQVTVDYAEGTGGTATAGTDYTAAGRRGTLTFAAGATSRTVDVTVTGDGTDEPDETVTVGAERPGERDAVKHGDWDGDHHGRRRGAVGDVGVVFVVDCGERGAATVTATLSHASSAATTVTVTGVTGFYTAGSDAVIVITAGSTANATDVATVAAVDNTTDEPDRTTTVTATVGNGVGTGSVSGAALTLEDDDVAPTATLDAGGFFNSGGRRHDDGERDALPRIERGYHDHR